MDAGTPADGSMYIYGIARPEPVADLRVEGVGDPPAAVVAVRHRDVAALVSGVPPSGERSPQATRRDLVAHARALEAVVARTTVLPMRFGMTLPGAQAVVDTLLADGYERWDALLEQYRDRVELVLKGFGDEAAMLRQVVTEDPEVSRGRRAGSVAERVRLGQRVAEALEARRQADADWLLGRLRTGSRKVRESPPAVAGMVVNAAFLVERSDVSAFDEEVAALAEEAGDRLRLRCLGPQPPYTFVEAGG